MPVPTNPARVTLDAELSAPRPSASPSTGRRRRTLRSRRRRIGLAFAALPLLLYTFVVLVPLVQSVQYSFFAWDGVSKATWVGLHNYASFISDPILRSTMWHVLVLIVFFSLLPIALGLLSAALLTRSKQPGMAVYRWIFFLPQVMTTVVIALVFKRIYAPQGLLNQVLDAVGLGSLTRIWLGDFSWALPALPARKVLFCPASRLRDWPQREPSRGKVRNRSGRVAPSYPESNRYSRAPQTGCDRSWLLGRERWAARG